MNPPAEPGLSKVSCPLISPLLILAALLIAAAPSKASVVTVTQFLTTNSTFSLKVTGGDFDVDDTHLIIKLSDWDIILNIKEDAGFINDSLTITGTAQHINAPVEPKNPNILNWKFSIDADQYEEGTHTVVPNAGLPTPILHPQTNHQNAIVRANLEFTTETSIFFVDDIVAWEMEVVGHHCFSGSQFSCDPLDNPLPPPGVPEPNSLALIALGGLMFAKLRR